MIAGGRKGGKAYAMRQLRLQIGGTEIRTAPRADVVIAIPALTLHQPWASMIADGRKRYETRSWKPPAAIITGRIAIHAGANRQHREYARWWGYDFDRLPFGAVVCTAKVVAAHHIWLGPYGVHPPGETLASVANDSLLSEADPCYIADAGMIDTDEYGDYSTGRWAWRLTDVEPVDPPVPARGRQGVWRWMPGIADA